MESQEEIPTCEIWKNDEEVNIIFEQKTVEEILELDIQTIEKTPDEQQEKNNEDIAIISPIFEQQAIEKEKEEYLE